VDQPLLALVSLLSISLMTLTLKPLDRSRIARRLSHAQHRWAC